MGVGEKLRDIYFSMEEKWYSMLDKIDAHIPIYKVVDKIDNVVPSFALLLIIILILVLLAGVSAFGVIGGGQEATLQLSVVDALGNGVDGATITLQGIDQTYYSNAFGLVDEINVPLGYTVSVTAEKGEMKSVEPIKIDSVATDATIILPINNISFSGKTIQFVSSYGTLINDELSLTYSCSSGTAPASETIYDGTTNVDVPSDCGTLTLNITSTKYERATETINDSVTTITLTEIAPVVNGRAIVNLTYNDVAINENVRVSAYRTSNSYYPEDTVTSSNGTAVFDLPEGDYTFESKQELGYKSERSDPVSVSSLNDATTSIALTKDIVGKIMVSVAKDLRDADDVLVTLKKGSSQLDNDRTDTNGIVEFTLAEDGEFVVIATEDGYCSDSAAVEIGDTVQLNLVRDTGNCGGELAIKVIDQEGKPVQFARAMIFAETSEDSYKLGYTTKTTNLDGNAFWDPVSYSDTDEQYKVFAFKGAYSGWSNAKAFTTIDKEEFVVQLEVPWGNVNINVKDKDGDALQFAEVQLFEDYANTKVSGRRIIEENTGNINFAVKAGQRVYAVIEKEGYESYMTIPKSVIGDGTINFDVTLSRPPREELLIEPLGFYKNDSKALRVQPGEEYIAMFEITAPKLYDELGFFVRVGKDSVSKTEMDKIYIKELLVPGQNYQLKGSTYHPPKGTSIDDDALNLEESKWAQATWPANGFIKGKIRVGVKVRIKQNAQLEELLEIGYRAWGVENSAYERDPEDMVLGSTESNSQKHARYALTKPYYAWVGTEALCDEHGENSFCITATYTDPDGIKAGFDTSFDAQNNAKYVLGIKVLNASGVGFDSTKIKLENAQDNVLLGNYNLLKPNNLAISANINNYETEWIENGSMPKETEFTFSSLEVTPQKTGYGSLKLRLRDDSTILLEKTFGINIASDKTMKIEFMVDNEFSTALPVLVSGKMQTITLKARNSQNNLEINDASVKLYDRFSNKLYETTTNALGIASIEVPAALPGENLKISVEKPEYATSETEFSISENVVEVTPETLSFTVNPQTQVEDMKTVKIENQTGFDLEIKDIKLDGKLKGLLSESRIESWFNNYAGTTIAASDYEEINFKVFSAPVIPAADDLDAKFIITVGNEYNEWIREIDATIRVGLGNDVDDPACLSITKDSWIASTQGEEIEVSFEIKNECRVEGQSVTLQNLGARIDSTDNQIGKLSAQSLTAYTELSKAYARTFKTSITEDEIVPVTIKFTPYGGTTGETSGTIVFSASNPTDSTDQEITIGMDYTLNVLNSDCLVIGTDLLTIGEEETGTFSITNNCPVEASFRVESELQLNNTTFTLASGASKEVIINRMENDVAGAYNNLVFGRLGNDSFEVIGNVKAILSADGCFSLSRYEFDVYDSPYNDFDGMDSAYLRNNCVQRNVNATMTGNEEFDNDQIWRNALLGGLTGLFTSKGTLYGEKKLWGNEKEKKAGAYAEISYKTLQKQTRKYAAKVSNESADAMTAAGYRYDLFSGATKIGLMSKVRAEITERYTYNYNNCSGDTACETNAFNIASKEYNDANIVIDNYIRGNIDLAWKNMQTAQKALNSELINVVDALGGDAKDIKVQQQAQAALGRISTEDIENQTDEQAKKNLATLKTKLKAKAETFNKKMELFETAINNFQTKSAAGEIPVFATSVINTSKQAVLAQFNLAGSYYQSGATIPPANTTALLDMFYGKIATAPTSVTPPTVTPPTSPPVQPPASVTPQPTSPTPQTSVPQLTGRTTLRTRRIVDPATETNPPLVLINLPAPETAAPLVDNSTPPESTPEPVQLTPAIMDQRLNSKIGGLEIITKGLFKNMFNEEAANVNMLNIVNSETGNGREQTMVAESTDAESQVESILTIYSNGQADLKITGRQGDEERYIYATNDPVPSLSEPVVYGKPMEEIDRIIGLKENFLNEINGCISPFKATPIDEECKENNGEGEEYTEEELYEIYGTLIEPLKEHTKKAVATGAKGRQIAHFGSPSINKRSLYITGLYTDNTSFGTNIYYKGHYKFELHIDLRLFNSNKPAYEINNLTLEQLREVLAGEPKHDLEAFQSEIDNINTDTQKPTGTAEEKVTQAITRVKANGFCTQLGVCDGSGANVELIQTNGAEFFMVYGSPTANVSGTTGEKVGKASFAGDKSKITNLLYLQYEPEFDKVAKKLSKGFNTRAWVQENKLRISIEQDDADGSKKMHEYKYLSSMNSWELTSFRKTGSNSAIIDPVLNPESKLVYNYNDATQEFVRVGTREYADSIKQQLRDQVNNEGTASFLLAVPTNNTRNNRSSGGLGGGFLGGNSMSNILISGTAGMLGQSALGGSIWAGIATLLTAQDTEINRPYVFAVPLVTITDAVLTAEGGITMTKGEPTYDFDEYYGSLATGATSPTGNAGNQFNSTYTSQGYNYNPQALSATMNLSKVHELTFTSGGLDNDSAYQPFVGMLTVTGKENVYNTAYDYDTIKASATTRGDFDSGGDNWFQDFFGGGTTTDIADMTDADLTIKEVRPYEKKFHLLFNSYEYVDCGPNTYPCAPGAISNCQVGSKTGSTGSDAKPKMLLDWDFSDVATNTCDESNPDYVYCDSTQLTISTIKKISELKTFFQSHSLDQCPQAIDILGTRTQELNGNEIDVAITRVQMQESTDGATIETIIKTNNNQEMDATITINVSQDGLQKASCSSTQTFTSEKLFSCEVLSSETGQGTFDVVATMSVELCDGCENRDTTNDSITSTLILGQAGAQECQTYNTHREYFTKVMAANNINEADQADVLANVNFTVNLLRDGFSNDFKDDFDGYMMQLATGTPEYTQELRELFLSDKFNVEWSNEPGAWMPGKYNARIIVEFAEDNWSWYDTNDVESVTLYLEYFGEPYPNNPIYNVAFNGSVGLNSDNGRLGYGVNYIQKTEEAMLISTQGTTNVYATPNPLNNALTDVETSVLRGTGAFFAANGPTRGDVLIVQRQGNTIEFVMNPTIAVPIIMDVERSTATDAYAYYSAEIDGEPQMTGSSFMTWKGIGQGCVDFTGASMTNYDESLDEREESGEGYGFFWPNAVASGKVSMYGVFFVPQKSIAKLSVTKQSETVTFETNNDSGSTIIIGSGQGVQTLREIFEGIEQEEICVKGGEYFWNNGTVTRQIEDAIHSRENTCAAIQ